MVIEARSQSSRLWQSAGYLLAASSHSERGKGALWGPFYKGTIPITRLHPHNLIAFQRPHHIGIWVSIYEILVDTNIPPIAMPAFYFWGARIEAQYPGPEWGPLSLLIHLSLTVALAIKWDLGWLQRTMGRPCPRPLGVWQEESPAPCPLSLKCRQSQMCWSSVHHLLYTWDGGRAPAELSG